MLLVAVVVVVVGLFYTYGPWSVEDSGGVLDGFAYAIMLETGCVSIALAWH